MLKKDDLITISNLKNEVEDLVSKRDWQKYHSAKNLAVSISLEAAELLEHFLWDSLEESQETFIKKKSEITNEMADIVIGVLALCNRFEIDFSPIVLAKINEIKTKYPVDKSKGKKTKYNKL